MAHASIVTDLGFGDAGKGSIVDFLAREALPDPTLVVRFNGGPQASHNVVTPDGRHHAFHQLGSASFVPGARTYLSRFMLIEPLELLWEVKTLEEQGVPVLLTVDSRCLVVTPYHRAANRLRETLRGQDRHGSCGAGVGEAVADATAGRAIRAGDLHDRERCIEMLERIRLAKVNEFGDLPLSHPMVAELRDNAFSRVVADTYADCAAGLPIINKAVGQAMLRISASTIFEGAQGVLLDEWRGFHPYTTWSTTTTENARTLLREARFEGEVDSIGLLRAYMVRHGPGPMPTWTPTWGATDVHNQDGPWQGPMRAGPLDLVLLRYAIAVAEGIDHLAITCIDQLFGKPPGLITCTSYDSSITNIIPAAAPDLAWQEHLTQLLFNVHPDWNPAVPGVFTPELIPHFVEHVAEQLRRPVSLISIGMTAGNKSRCDHSAAVHSRGGAVLGFEAT